MLMSVAAIVLCALGLWLAFVLILVRILHAIAGKTAAYAIVGISLVAMTVAAIRYDLNCGRKKWQSIPIDSESWDIWERECDTTSGWFLAGLDGLTLLVLLTITAFTSFRYIQKLSTRTSNEGETV